MRSPWHCQLVWQDLESLAVGVELKEVEVANTLALQELAKRSYCQMWGHPKSRLRLLVCSTFPLPLWLLPLPWFASTFPSLLKRPISISRSLPFPAFSIHCLLLPARFSPLLIWVSALPPLLLGTLAPSLPAPIWTSRGSYLNQFLTFCECPFAHSLVLVYVWSKAHGPHSPLSPSESWYWFQYSSSQSRMPQLLWLQPVRLEDRSTRSS